VTRRAASYAVRWSAQALADLLRLHEHLLQRAEFVEDLDLADQATEEIEHAVTHRLGRHPYLYRRVGRSQHRRELVMPFGAFGYVALYEVLSATEVLVLAVRHQREDDLVQPAATR
jgi:plasmid stabilization system protein ParE